MFENNAGQLYEQSGKVNIIKYLIALVISLGLSGLLGIGYGFLSHLNPFIYLNIVLLIGVFFLSMLALGITTSMAASRNKIATVIFGVISSVFLLYNAWIGTVSSETSHIGLWDGFTFGVSFDYLMYYASHQQMSIGRLGRSGSDFGEGMMMVLYVVEAVVIIGAPVYMLTSTKDYYCEPCGNAFDSDEKYFINDGVVLSKIESGNLTGLSDSTQVMDTQFSTIPVGSKLLKVDAHQCEKCKSAIVDVELGITSINKESYSFDKKEVITSGLYINEVSKSILFKS
jgi:hypothetical protein